METRQKWLIATVVLLFFMGISFLVGVYIHYTLVADKLAPDVNAGRMFTQQELLDEANKLRAEKGVAPLKLDYNMVSTAQERADDMANRGYFSHYDPVTGENLAKNMNKYWPEPCQGVSENIQKTTDNFSYNPFYWWVTSKPHYDAIIDSKYDTTGFGISVEDNKVMYVQHFCDIR